MDLLNELGKPFPPSVKKGRRFEIPDGINAHLTKGCRENVHHRKVVEVASGLLNRGVNPAWLSTLSSRSGKSARTRNNYQLTMRSADYRCPTDAMSLLPGFLSSMRSLRCSTPHWFSLPVAGRAGSVREQV
jgi:hypothetical protein